jgi:hypothetical protein
MNSYRIAAFALHNRFCEVFQQAFLNNTQPGGPSHRFFASATIFFAAATLLTVGAGNTQAASLTSTPSSVSFGTVAVGN